MSGPNEPSRIAAARWTRGETVWTAVIITLFWGALNLAWLSGALTIPWDAKAHFHPQLQFLADAIAKGDSPFWNPHVFAGHPQIADPQSLIFSPPHLLAAWLFPKPEMWVGDAVILGLLLVGALALMLLFRDRGWAPAGAVVAALVFAFGSSASWRIQHIGQVASLAYFALALWLLSRALGRRSARWGAAAGAVIGLMILGRDQVALLGVYTLAGLTIAAWLQSGAPFRALTASIKPLFAAGVFTVLVAAVPILFTLALAEQSNRPAIDLDGAGKGSLHPASLLTLFIANLFGAAGPLENFWGQPSPAWQARFGDVELFLARNMSVAYLGALPLIAILGVGIARGRAWDPGIRAVSIAALAMLLYALGRYTPFFQVVYSVLPGVSFYRRPADALFNFGALAAILAGYCVHAAVTSAAMTSPAPTARLTKTAWALVLGMAAAAAIAALLLAAEVGRLQVAAIPMLIALLVFLLGGATFWLLPRAQAAQPLAAALFAASVLGVDLAVSNGPSESTGLPTRQYEVLSPSSRNETIAALKAGLARTAAPDRRDRVELAGIDFHWPNASMTHGLDHTLGYNPLRLGGYSRATGAGDHVALPDQRNFSPLMPGYRSLMADMLGLRFIASKVPLQAIDRTLSANAFRELPPTPDARISENPGALPRAMIVPDVQTADFEALLTTGIWPRDFNPRLTVLTEAPVEPLNGCPPTNTQPGAQAAIPAPAISSYRNTRIVIETNAPRCAFLVLNDAWQRWWTVEVNGQPEALLKANVIFRAVRIPAGPATVTFRFEPFQGLLDARWRKAGSVRGAFDA
jgi:hypothetical protein